jgi:putative hemolysin
MRVASALRTVPFPLGLIRQLDAFEMEPLYLARVIVAANHLPVGDLAAHTINRLVGVYRTLVDAQAFHVFGFLLCAVGFTVIFIRVAYGFLFG